MNSTKEDVNKKIIVKKFGGATISSPEKIIAIAKKLKTDASNGDKLIVVVSAMGKTTNSLIELANQVSKNPNQREKDMLLSVGERITMSLLSMALHDIGVKAISFTGSQAGILTNDSHENARVENIKPTRVLEEMMKNKIIILAGFQGLSFKNKEITTLGRGGSDTSAVAITAALNATQCEILKDVPAVFSADPNLVSDAKPITSLSYEQLLEMTFWGAKVLHYRSAELAAMKRVKIYVGPSKEDHKTSSGTWIQNFQNKDLDMKFKPSENQYECSKIISINSFNEILKLRISAATAAMAVDKLKREFTNKEIIFPQILNMEFSNSSDYLITVSAPHEVISQIRKNKFSFDVSAESLASIALTCTGLPHYEIQEEIYNKLSEVNIAIFNSHYSSLSLILIISKEHLEQATKALHELIK
ncbi:MAG: aspartate kinase [Bdellovibrionales bacterium]|nr:aspartate kinase [Bdellovibrionales bacterium]